VRPEQSELFGAAAPALPEGFVYRLEILTIEEERALLAEIARLPLEQAKYKEYTARRRVAYFGHDYDFSANRLGDAPPIPGFLEALRARLARWMGIAPDEFVTALVAEYSPGTPLFAIVDGWHDEGTTTDAFWGPSVHWNSYLQMYVMLLNRAKDTKYNQEGIYVSFSPRLDDPRLWSWPLKVLNGGSWYPQVVGLDDASGTDKVAGEWARFFMTGSSQYLIHFTR